jgi:hypothetical protein
MTVRNLLLAGADLSAAGSYIDLATGAAAASIPATGDTLLLSRSAVSITAGWTALAAVVLARLTRDQTFTGNIGDATHYVQVQATKVYLGQSLGNSTAAGPPLEKWDFGAGASTITVFNTAFNGMAAGLPPTQLLCNNAATVLNVAKGQVGVALSAGETATLSLASSSYVNSQSSDANLQLGAGVTVTTLAATGGNLKSASAHATTLATNNGGTLTLTGDGAITTVTNNGGTVYPLGAGTITAVNAFGGLTDFTPSPVARSVGTLSLSAGGSAKMDPDIVACGAVQIVGKAIFTASAV